MEDCLLTAAAVFGACLAMGGWIAAVKVVLHAKEVRRRRDSLKGPSSAPVPIIKDWDMDRWEPTDLPGRN